MISPVSFGSTYKIKSQNLDKNENRNKHFSALNYCDLHEIDYKAKREKEHILTNEEINYIRNDVEIMARALEIMFEQKLTKMTIGSCALSNYKKTNKSFKFYFPVLPYEIDQDIRKSYKGRFYLFKSSI